MRSSRNSSSGLALPFLSRFGDKPSFEDNRRLLEIERFRIHFELHDRPHDERRDDASASDRIEIVSQTSLRDAVAQHAFDNPVPLHVEGSKRVPRCGVAVRARNELLEDSREMGG